MSCAIHSLPLSCRLFLSGAMRRPPPMSKISPELSRIFVIAFFLNTSHGLSNISVVYRVFFARVGANQTALQARPPVRRAPVFAAQALALSRGQVRVGHRAGQEMHWTHPTPRGCLAGRMRQSACAMSYRQKV